MGSCYYLLQEVKPDTWYEIPAMFSLQLKRAISDVGMNRLRKLLNTEKLILKVEDLDGSIGGLYVLVTVEPEESVAIPDVQEREIILFNIGVYEIQKYDAFVRNGAGVGMGWKKSSDPGNRLTTAMIIILVEWVVMLLLAFYFDQVMSSGDGKKKNFVLRVDAAITMHIEFGSNCQPIAGNYVIWRKYLVEMLEFVTEQHLFWMYYKVGRRKQYLEITQVR
ncbi:ABC transporter A family member 5 [Bienertia sinuspersici]